MIDVIRLDSWVWCCTLFER